MTAVVSDRRKSRAAATLVFAAAVSMACAALIGAYFVLRPGAEVWPSEEMTFDEYRGATWILTSLLASVFATWGVWATRRELRSQANAAFILSLLMAALSANMVIYVISQLGFGPTDGPYDFVVWCALALGPAVTVVACAALVAGLARSAVALTNEARIGVVEQVSWIVYLSTAVCIAMYWLVWLVK